MMKAHHHDTVPCGSLLIAVGLFIRYHIGRRRFNRRGMTGLQQFDSYGVGLITTIIESLIDMIGKLILWAGILLLAVAGFDHFKF